MIIYNVTVKINLEVEQEWVKWMKTVHIPEVLETGCFLSHRFLRLMIEEDDGVTYAIQYAAENLEKINQYQARFAPALQQAHRERYNEQFVAFRTLLGEVE